MIRRTSLDDVIGRLQDAGCIAADEEAADLVAVALDDAELESWIRRREQGEPLAWITGRIEFCGISVRVDPGLYVPRIQTEELARRAGVLLSRVDGTPRAIDLCTGTGAIAVYLKTVVPAAEIVAVDRDEQAVRCALRNGVIAVVGHLGDPLARGAFDVVTAVAPYVPTAELAFLPADVTRYEPLHALDGGPDGLDILRALIASAAEILRPGGWLMIEIGGDQAQTLTPTLQTLGFGGAETWADEDGDLRGLATQLSMR